MGESTASGLTARSFWLSYTAGVVVLSVAAVLLGQHFIALEFARDVASVILDRLLSLAVMALFLERAVEVYIIGSRRLGEMLLLERIDEAKEDAPDDKARLRELNRRLARYKVTTQQIAFIISLAAGMVIAATGFRILDGMMVISEELRRNPTWQTHVWYGVDILITGGIIGGGAAGIHNLIQTLSRPSGQARRPAGGG